MLNLAKNKKGQSILEVIVAMAIFALVGASIATMAVGSFNALIQGGEYTQAEALAQEALEAIKSIKDRAWNENRYNQSGITADEGYWAYLGEGTEETIGVYTRSISFYDVCRDTNDDIAECPAEYTDAHSKEARVAISWETSYGKIATVERSVYLTNWDSNMWPQSDWSGGDGQTIWLNISRYDSDDGGIYINNSGKITLGQTLTAQAYTTWPFTVSGNYTYDSDYIEVSDGKAKLKTIGEGGSGNILNPGFEHATETSYDWNFSEPNDYVYTDEKIEVFGGLAQLKSVGGSSASGETSNPGFDTDSGGWTYYDWSQDAGDPDATGTWYASGGNPDGYVDVNLPSNLKNLTLGGYWEQAITTTVDNPEAYCEIDWKAFAVTLPRPGVNSLYVAIYLNNASGEPTGTPILQKDFTATFDWESHSGDNRINCSDLMTSAGTYYYKIAVWISAKNQNTGPIRVGFDNAKVSWSKSEGGSYPTDEPAIYPNGSFSALGVLSWDSFTETATKNGGEINYQLSSDDGENWQYWDGSTWATAGAIDYNSASVINTNISNFSTSTEQIKFRAFLKSDGTQLVQLDNINIGLTPSPSVWSFGTWDIGGGETAPTGSLQTSGGMPNRYVDITAPASKNNKVGGYWQQSFTTTESNPSATFTFDYKVVDFNNIPNVAEIRVYLDTSAGDPVNQIITPITLSAETNWASSTEINISSFISTPGTYYLKMAFWVETPGGATGAGPFTVGFDNIDLDWLSSSYPTNKPTISSTNSFSPAAITEWLSFIATTTTTGGAEVYYQLSDDDGATWQYWDGDSWEVAPESEPENEENYNSITVINYYINQFNTANKKLMFRAFLVSDGTQYLEIDEIRVDYKITEPQYYGNQFYADVFSGVGLMSKSTDITSLRFNAGTNKIVEAVRVYLEQAKGTSPIYRYGIQSDSGGQPSGIWLGSTNSGYGDHQATATGWNRIILNEGVSLVAGNTYHLVVQHQSGTINAANSIELRKSEPANFLLPYDNSSNPSSNVLSSDNGGASWTTQGSQPIYVLDYSDVTYEGNSYHTFTEHQIYGTNYYGEQFGISGANNHISSAEFFISENNQSPQGDLELVLYDVTNSQELNTGVIADPSQVRNNEYTWVRFDFPTVTTLEVGNVYRLYLQSPDSGAQAHYLVMSVDNINSSVYNGINYGGTSSFFVSSTDGGSSWVTTAVNQDIAGYRFGKTIFNGSGYLISSAYDTGTTSAFNIIEWDQITPTCSPACEVQMQIQTAPDNGGVPGAWSTTWCGPEGEDGDETDYFSVSSGELISTDHNGDQWIRYKANLVGDTTETPTLEEVRIYYQ